MAVWGYIVDSKVKEQAVSGAQLRGFPQYQGVMTLAKRVVGGGGV
jgi:hypothetical protein